MLYVGYFTDYYNRNNRASKNNTIVLHGCRKVCLDIVFYKRTLEVLLFFFYICYKYMIKVISIRRSNFWNFTPFAVTSKWSDHDIWQA